MLKRIKRTFSALDRGNERGGVLAFVAVGLVALLVAAGLAIDAGQGYILKAHLSRAVDAAALSAAKSLRGGEDAARSRAMAIIRANGIDPGTDGGNISISFGTNEFGEKTVAVTADQAIPTLLVRLIGRDTMAARSAAVAGLPAPVARDRARDRAHLQPVRLRRGR